MPTVREFMSHNPAAVTRDTPASEAARVMRDADVGILPVVEEGILQGVVTDRDLAIEALGERGDVPVSELMSPGVTTISPDDTVEDAQRLMAENDIRRLVVCDGDRVVGIVSVGDLAVRVSDTVAGEVLHETGPAPTEAVDNYGAPMALDSDASAADGGDGMTSPQRGASDQHDAETHADATPHTNQEERMRQPEQHRQA